MLFIHLKLGKTLKDVRFTRKKLQEPKANENKSQVPCLAQRSPGWVPELPLETAEAPQLGRPGRMQGHEQPETLRRCRQAVTTGPLCTHTHTHTPCKCRAAESEEHGTRRPLLASVTPPWTMRPLAWLFLPRFFHPLGECAHLGDCWNDSFAKSLPSKCSRVTPSTMAWNPNSLGQTTQHPPQSGCNWRPIPSPAPPHWHQTGLFVFPKQGFHPSDLFWKWWRLFFRVSLSSELSPTHCSNTTFLPQAPCGFLPCWSWNN